VTRQKARHWSCRKRYRAAIIGREAAEPSPAGIGSFASITLHALATAVVGAPRPTTDKTLEHQKFVVGV
jgi:hypothetical protein